MIDIASIMSAVHLVLSEDAETPIAIDGGQNISVYFESQPTDGEWEIECFAFLLRVGQELGVEILDTVTPLFSEFEMGTVDDLVVNLANILLIPT